MYTKSRNKLEFDLWLQLKKMIEIFEDKADKSYEIALIEESKKVIEDYDWQY
ncbi:MAG: hypothetical protein ACOCP8_01355 [archaeon]